MSDIKELDQRLRATITRMVEEKGFKVFELRFFYSQGRLFIRVLVDLACGGISLDQCSGLNQEISDYLEADSLIDQSFVVEVFSPGVDRDLVNIDDFLRVKEKDINLWLKENIEGKDYYQARVLDVDLGKEEIVLSINNKIISLPLTTVKKARQKKISV